MALPASVSAQRVGLLPPPQDLEPGAEEGWEAAADAVIARLERDGEPVMSAAEVGQRGGSACASLDCAPDLVASLSLRWIAAIEILPGSRLRLHLIEARGHRFSGEGAYPDGDLAGAARRALALARQRRLAARLPTLRVTATREGEGLEGVEIYVDEELQGLTPALLRLREGRHRVHALRDGVRYRAESVRVESGAREELELSLDDREVVDREGQGERRVGPRRREPSEWNWVIGGALGIGGVVALISPLQTFARDGECLEEVPIGPGGLPACREQVVIGPQTGVLLAVGLAALAGAAVIQATQPITVEVAADEGGAMLRVGGRL